MTVRVLVIAGLLLLAGCTSSSDKPAAQPPAASSTPAGPSPTPTPPDLNTWTNDPDGKAACDAIKPIADGGPNPGTAALLTIAEQAAKAKNTPIAAAGVDLATAARTAQKATASDGDRIAVLRYAYALGKKCLNERYYLVR